MANYAVANSTTSVGTGQAIAAAYKSLLEVVASETTNRRGKIYDLLIGTNGTPADNYVEWAVPKITTMSTGSTMIPLPLDAADAAALTKSVINSTTEPTVTAGSELFYVGINQRASYRWVAAPGSELVWPATSCAGYALRARSAAYTGTATGTVYFQEQ